MKHTIKGLVLGYEVADGLCISSKLPVSKNNIQSAYTSSSLGYH